MYLYGDAIKTIKLKINQKKNTFLFQETYYFAQINRFDVGSCSIFCSFLIYLKKNGYYDTFKKTKTAHRSNDCILLNAPTESIF